MTIGIDLEDGAFEQDVRELLMAFYPGAGFVYAEKLSEADILVSGRFLNSDGAEEGKYALDVQKAVGLGQNDESEADLSGKDVCEADLSREDACEVDLCRKDDCEAGEWFSGEADSDRMERADWREVFSQLSPVIRKGLTEAQENLPFAVNRADRKEMKNRIKRRLYFLLMLETKKELPWGALTGIRPVKIPEEKLSLGWSDERILGFLEEDYLVGEKKRKLCLEIAKEERALLGGVDAKNGYSLYVGIPFCPTTCLYCSFTSYPIGKWKGRLSEYLDCLQKELTMVREWAGEERKLQTIYIGGGTPTSLPEEELKTFMEMVHRTFPADSLEEFTVEAGRPDSLNREKLRILKAYGSSRISINPQSMNQKTLDLIGRRHSVEQVKEIFSIAREEGFDNINMDIILGLPGEGEEEIRHTLDEVRALEPDSLTVHCLALKRAARLNTEKQQYAGYPMASGKMLDGLVDLAAEQAGAMGMKPYYLYRQKNMAGNLENVGYAREGKACLYNVYMMEERQTIAACGAGTTTKRLFSEENRVERCENVKEVSQYIERIGEMIERKKKLFMDAENGI